ncbi:MAG: hypothetical protein H0W81_06575 [Chloroflexi bacterium]|nr:hypothetical protein [Chloroflexota bacterium]
MTYTLTPAQTAQLDTLTVAWSAAFGGQTQVFTEIVEIAGGFLFSIAQAKARYPTLTVDQIIEARTLAEEQIEDACDVAFVPRFTRASLSGDGSRLLSLPRSRVRTIRTVTDFGVTVDISATTVIAGHFASSLNYWTYGSGNLIVGFEHGYDSPPAAITQAALDLAGQSFGVGAFASIDPRAQSLVTDDGTLNFGGFASAYSFGLPSVDRAISQYREVALA